mgnify:CR=1 FL=1
MSRRFARATVCFHLLTAVGLASATAPAAPPEAASRNAAAASAEVAPAEAPRLFAFDNGTGRGAATPAEQAKMLKELGYSGIGYSGTAGIPEMLAALEAEGLTMFSTYVGADLDPAKPPYDPGLPKAIEQLKGQPTILWLYVLGPGPADAERDCRAVEILRQVADLAAASDLRVALYPHVGFYVATVDDALRLAEKTQRDNVGVSFNLCHFLKLDDEQNLEAVLRRAMPKLFLVSINGADRGETRTMGWDRLIQSLDRGSFDNAALVGLLGRLGYRGPIGLQCYGIGAPPREHLGRSIAAWRKIVAEPPRR